MNVPYIIYSVECVCYLEKVFIASTKHRYYICMYFVYLNVLTIVHISNIYSSML